MVQTFLLLIINAVGLKMLIATENFASPETVLPLTRILQE